METRPFGSTGERVTVIGLGGAPLNQQSHADGVATARRALDLGITYFDTSPGYGAGDSQVILGEALAGDQRRRLLATKLGHLSRTEDFRSVRALRAQLDDNLRMLRCERVDTLQVHEADWSCWWTDGVQKGELIRDDIEYDFSGAPVMQVLRQAKREGRCRFVGITGNNAAQMARILRAVDVDTFLVAFNYDLLWRRARRVAIPLATEKGVAMIVGGVFRYGELAREHPEWRQSPPAWCTPAVQARLDSLSRIRRQSTLSLVTLTIRYLLADPDLSTILVGAASPEELNESVRAAASGPLPPDLHAVVEGLGVDE